MPLAPLCASGLYSTCNAEGLTRHAAGLYQDMVVAVKIAEVSVPRARAKAHLTEVQIAGTLRHPNVVSTCPRLPLPSS